MELQEACEALRSATVRPELPLERFNAIGRVMVVLFVVWLVCAGVRTGWNYMLSNAAVVVQDPVLASAYKALADRYRGEYYYFKLPYDSADGRTFVGHLKGYFNSVWDLPMDDNKDYDVYKVRNHYWVWAVPKSGSKVQWIDP
jgi:hypothetical protein